MPLTGVSRRVTPLGAFTFKELLAERRRAERALRRGRTPSAARAVLERIDAELAERRAAKLARSAPPDGLPGPLPGEREAGARDG